MAAKAVICIVFGLGLLFVPAVVMSLFGVSLTAGASAVAQLLGAAFVLLSIMLWLARNAPSTEVALKAIVLAAFAGDAIGFAVALLAQLLGAMNGLGWLVVALYLLMALGFGYYEFNPESQANMPQARPT